MPSPAHQLADFLIGGAPKCATTSLASALRAHPDVFVPEAKELNFFGFDDWHRGPDWYSASLAGAGPGQIIGEATPWYMSSPQACRQIHALMPGARLVFVLRNPIERAWSHYWFRRSQLEEGRSLRSAFSRELATPPDQLRPRSDYLLHPGLYARHLRMYAERFPRHQIHVVLMDDLKAHPGATVDGVLDFLGLPRRHLALDQLNSTGRHRSDLLAGVAARMIYSDAPWKRGMRRFLAEPVRARVAGSVRRANRRFNTRPGGKFPMPPALRAALTRFFAPEVEQLARQLDRDLAGWLSSPPH